LTSSSTIRDDGDHAHLLVTYPYRRGLHLLVLNGEENRRAFDAALGRIVRRYPGVRFAIRSRPEVPAIKAHLKSVNGHLLPLDDDSIRAAVALVWLGESSFLEATDDHFVHYAWARQYGATHAECMEVIDRGDHLGDYAWARQHGATHAECMEAANRQANLRDYASARWLGYAHREAVVRALR